MDAKGGRAWKRFDTLPPEKQIRRGVHDSVQALERDIRAFIEVHNADPRPFRWTKSADDILASVKRFCLRSLEVRKTQIEKFRFRTLVSILDKKAILSRDGMTRNKL